MCVSACVSVCVLKIHIVLRQCKHIQYGCVFHVSVFQTCVHVDWTDNTTAPLEYHSSQIRLNHFREYQNREEKKSNSVNLAGTRHIKSELNISLPVTIP